MTPIFTSPALIFKPAERLGKGVNVSYLSSNIQGLSGSRGILCVLEYFHDFQQWHVVLADRQTSL